MKAKSYGFTLIELLVCLAVIALLASLLLPALSRAKARAQRTSCLNKLKNWGAAMQMFTDDNEYVLPREDAMDDVNPWAVTRAPENQDVWYNCVALAMGTRSVAQYAENPLDGEFYSSRSMFRCPTARFEATTVAYPIFSLVMNSQLAGRNESVSKGQIVEPALTAMFLDCGVPDEPRAIPAQRPFNGQPKAFANRFSARHGGGGNIAMADGSVSFFRASDVVDPTTGRSIYPPTRVIWGLSRDQEP